MKKLFTLYGKQFIAVLCSNKKLFTLFGQQFLAVSQYCLAHLNISPKCSLFNCILITFQLHFNCNIYKNY